MIINEVLYISGAFLLSLKKGPEFAPYKLRRNAIFCFHPETKKALWQDWFIEHFPKGVTDPEYCVLKFTGDKATLWIDGKFIKQKL